MHRESFKNRRSLIKAKHKHPQTVCVVPTSRRHLHTRVTAVICVVNHVVQRRIAHIAHTEVGGGDIQPPPPPAPREESHRGDIISVMFPVTGGEVGRGWGRGGGQAEVRRRSGGGQAEVRWRSGAGAAPEVDSDSSVTHTNTDVVSGRFSDEAELGFRLIWKM